MQTPGRRGAILDGDDRPFTRRKEVHEHHRCPWRLNDHGNQPRALTPISLSTSDGEAAVRFCSDCDRLGAPMVRGG
jgi:hypothetical protein